jgi:hypothetical protein
LADPASTLSQEDSNAPAAKVAGHFFVRHAVLAGAPARKRERSGLLTPAHAGTLRCAKSIGVTIDNAA